MAAETRQPSVSPCLLNVHIRQTSRLASAASCPVARDPDDAVVVRCCSKHDRDGVVGKPFRLGGHLTGVSRTCRQPREPKPGRRSMFTYRTIRIAELTLALATLALAAPPSAAQS
jgi:hypothetical protein